jgi:hypothetical protein
MGRGPRPDKRADHDRDLLIAEVAPIRKPVFRSCDVLPPLEAAMQTMAPMESAVT